MTKSKYFPVEQRPFRFSVGDTVYIHDQYITWPYRVEKQGRDEQGRPFYRLSKNGSPSLFRWDEDDLMTREERERLYGKGK